MARRGSQATRTNLSETLREAIDDMVMLPSGESVVAARLLACQIRDLVVLGTVTLPNGRVELLDHKERRWWINWLFNRLEGMPKQSTAIEMPLANWPEFVAVGEAAKGCELVGGPAGSWDEDEPAP